MTQTYPLAIDADGNAFEVPAEAVAWRVRRDTGTRGQPRNVFDRETGRPLKVPIAAEVEDLIEAGCAPGRYRLRPLDESGRELPDLVAVVEIADDAEAAHEAATVSASAPPLPVDAWSTLVQLVRELADTNCRTTEALASAFGHVRPAQALQLAEPAPAAVAPKSDDRAEALLDKLAALAAVGLEAWKTKNAGTTASAGINASVGGAP